MCILEPHCMRNEDGKIHAKFLTIEFIENIHYKVDRNEFIILFISHIFIFSNIRSVLTNEWGKK